MIYLGLDVHHKSTTIVVVDEQGEVLESTKAPTTMQGLGQALKKWFERQQGAPCAMESGAKAYLVSSIIAELGGAPKVFAADEVHQKTRSQKKKTDERDAYDLAQNLRSGALRREVKLPPLAMQRLRKVLSVRQSFIKQRTQAVNGAKALLRECGADYGDGVLCTRRGWERLLAMPLAELDHQLLLAYQQAYAAAEEQVQQLTKQAEELGEQAPQFAVLESIPGIGPLNRLAAAAWLFDVSRFPSGKYLAAYVGVVPAMYNSGQRERHGHITREGPGLLRALLVEAAQQACRRSNPLYPFYARLSARCGHKKAVVALANKLCRIFYALLTNQRAFDLERLGVEYKPTATTKVRLYRLQRRPARAA